MTTKEWFMFVAQPREHSRRARNVEPPQPEHQTSERDEWFFGFASALASIWRLHHDGQMVRHILSSNGITLKHFENAGVDEFDVRAIRTAVNGRR